MKVLLRTAWVIPILTLRLILWPDENNAAGKNCCVSKTGAVACQHCQASPSQAGATTTAANTRRRAAKNATEKLLTPSVKNRKFRK